MKELIIVGGVIDFLDLFQIALPTIILIGLFLLFPIFIDLLLYGLIRQYKNTASHRLALLKRCGFVTNPRGKAYVQLNTYNEFTLARVNLIIGEKTASLGLFSAEILDENNNNELKKTTTFLKQNNIKEKHLINDVLMVRHLLLFFQQDIELCLDKERAIISLKLHQNHADSRVINRHILLKHYQLQQGTINEKRFTSALFHEVFVNPTPLMLDILRRRWDKKGGCLSALQKLGLPIKPNDETKEQFVVFSNQIYLDELFEKSIFSTHKLSRLIRKKVLNIKFRLATECILLDYYTLILPRTEMRLTKLKESLDKPLSVRRLKRVIYRALRALSKESAMWQFYCSLLHQHAFNQLQKEAKKSKCDVSSLMNYPLSLSQALPMPSHYELSSKHESIDSGKEFKNNDRRSSSRHAFLNTERVRTDMRQRQLKEWQLIGLLLEKLRETLRVPISLVYLTTDDFHHLSRDRIKLINLLKYRSETWKTQNQWHFPASFSLQEMEQFPSPDSIEQQDSDPLKSYAIRVAGNQQMIMGTAVIFLDNLALDSLPKGSILIAENLLPEQIIACQHIHGIILKKGGYLSHTSIIAREKNIPLVAQYHISAIKDQDKLIIQSGNQITILSNKALEWAFLEGMASTPVIGNKAYRLAMMSQAGFNIPPTIILKHNSVIKIHQLASSEAIHDASDPLWQELKQLLNLFASTKTPLIVRSSTNVEDSSHYSYAGLFYSKPNIVTIEELISAIAASWQNVLDRAEVIKHYSGETQLELNLILQPYIKGQFGGVLFTESSMPGLMQVEIASGGAEGITEGNAALTSLYIDERGQPVHGVGEKNSLSNQEYQALCSLGRKLEAFFGKPQDIEWIIADQKIYIIQSRDILTPPEETDFFAT